MCQEYSHNWECLPFPNPGNTEQGDCTAENPDVPVAVSSSLDMGTTGQITDHPLFHGHTTQGCGKIQRDKNVKLLRKLLRHKSEVACLGGQWHYMLSTVVMDRSVYLPYPLLLSIQVASNSLFKQCLHVAGTTYILVYTPTSLGACE